jgi:hypothetical protein
MSFCCGTDMLLTIAAIRQDGTTVTNVPIVFCLICEQINVHPDVEFAFDMLLEYAVKDRAREVDLMKAVPPAIRKTLYNPENHLEYRKIDYVLQQQIDHALDLFSMAQRLEDPQWKEEILQRLTVLHQKKTKE